MTDDLFKPSKKAVKNEDGFIFDPWSGFAKVFNKKRNDELMMVLVYNKDEKPLEYLLYRNGIPIYANKNYENVCFRANIIIASEKLK